MMHNFTATKVARILVAAATGTIVGRAYAPNKVDTSASTLEETATAQHAPQRPVSPPPRPGAATVVAPRGRRRSGAPARANEPCYTRKQVAEADGADGRPMWVTYRDGVYDVTAFRHAHPGGPLIEQAAGGDVGAFWDIWAYHHLAPSVGLALEKCRIGTLLPDDVPTTSKTSSVRRCADEAGQPVAADPYNAEPARGGVATQHMLTSRPYCSETPYTELGAHYLTSAEAMYVRNHSPVPEVAWPDANGDDATARAAAAAAHEIVFDDSVSGGGGARTMTLAQLEARFGTATITAVLQCAGNRAAEDIAATGPTGFSGTPYAEITGGMVGNAQWSGVRLADMLPALFPTACADVRRRTEERRQESTCAAAEAPAPAEEEEEDAWHVVFEGDDGYSGSVPLSRAIERQNDCLLARAMNGQPLSPDHGFPCRALLPGIAGARNIKWVQSISLQRGPSDAPWNAYYYKNAKAQQIQELPLQSIILAPADGDKREEGATTAAVRGIAYSGGSGRAVARVDVSTDGGKNWIGATLHYDEVLRDDSSASFGWVRWTAQVPLRCREHGPTEVVARATDAAGTVQPEVAPKQRGYLYNGWSRVSVA